MSLQSTQRSAAAFVDRLTAKAREVFKEHFGIIFMIPPSLFLVLLTAIPVVYGFWLSLHDIGIFTIQGEFIGLQNYRELYTRPAFFDSLWIGLYFTALSVGVQLVIALALALILNRDFFGSSVARTLAIFPYLVPTIAVVLMWKWMLSPVHGVVNIVLQNAGIISESISFFGNPGSAMLAVVIASSWKFTSFALLILLARLQSIDQTMYEQAKVSGASAVQAFRTITLPNLRSAILLIILLRGIWMFNKFDIVWLFTKGGPVNATRTLPIYIFRTTFFERDLGIGSAAAINLFMMLVVVAAVYFWYFKPSQEVETAR
jgi:multiple sugar transport system permease protein